MNTNEAFEKLWAIKGHAQAIDKVIELDGVSDKNLKILNETISRMQELIQECLVYRDIK